MVDESTSFPPISLLPFVKQFCNPISRIKKWVTIRVQLSSDSSAIRDKHNRLRYSIDQAVVFPNTGNLFQNFNWFNLRDPSWLRRQWLKFTGIRETRGEQIFSRSDADIYTNKWFFISLYRTSWDVTRPHNIEQLYADRILKCSFDRIQRFSFSGLVYREIPH